MISFDCWAIVALWTSKCALWCLAKNWQDVPCRNEPPLAQQQPTSIKRQLPFTVNIIYRERERITKMWWIPNKFLGIQARSCALIRTMTMSFLHIFLALFHTFRLCYHKGTFITVWRLGWFQGWSSVVIYGHLWSTELRTETWWKSQMLHLFF